jgi:hypothetical protein
MCSETIFNSIVLEELSDDAYIRVSMNVERSDLD